MWLGHGIPDVRAAHIDDEPRSVAPGRGGLEFKDQSQQRECRPIRGRRLAMCRATPGAPAIDGDVSE